VTKPLDIVTQNTNLARQPVIYQLSPPGKIVDRCVDTHQSNRYHKTMNYTEKELVFFLYGMPSNKYGLKPVQLILKRRLNTTQSVFRL